MLALPATATGEFEFVVRIIGLSPEAHRAARLLDSSNGTPEFSYVINRLRDDPSIFWIVRTLFADSPN